MEWNQQYLRLRNGSSRTLRTRLDVVRQLNLPYSFQIFFADGANARLRCVSKSYFDHEMSNSPPRTSFAADGKLRGAASSRG